MILLERLRVDRFKGLRDVDLAFPERGSVLVEGLNEAGKSTLFESVYFALYGSLLASEENRGGLESAIGYRAARATGELGFRGGHPAMGGWPVAAPHPPEPRPPPRPPARRQRGRGGPDRGGEPAHRAGA